MNKELLKQAEGARAAAVTLAGASTEVKNRALRLIADALSEHQDEILAANQLDVER